MMIFGPRSSRMTSAVTVTLASALASEVTFSPSTSRTAGSCTVEPAPPDNRSTTTMSPTDTFSCRPPALTIAYTTSLLISARRNFWARRLRRARLSAKITGVRAAPHQDTPDVPGYGVRCPWSNLVRFFGRRSGGLGRLHRLDTLDGVRELGLGGLGHPCRLVGRRDRAGNGALARGVLVLVLVGMRRGGRDRRQGGLDRLPRLGQHRHGGRRRRGRPGLLAPGPLGVRLAGWLGIGLDRRPGVHRLAVDDESPPVAVRARLAERLEQALTHPLAGHLDQPQRRHLGDLVLGPVPAQALDQPTEHQVAEVTSLGLVQMTRKRVGQGLLEAFSEPCADCNGRGFIIHSEPVDSGSSVEPDAKPAGEPDTKRPRRKKAGTASPSAPAVPVLPEAREAVKATLATIAAAAAHAHEHKDEDVAREPAEPAQEAAPDEAAGVPEAAETELADAIESVEAVEATDAAAAPTEEPHEV